MRWGWRWALLILAAALADVGVRFATSFTVVWVVRAEAILFLGTSLALWMLHSRRAAQVRWQARLQQVLVAAFALAGLRAVLWVVGLPVARANLVIGFGAALLIAFAVLRWRRATGAA